MKRSGKSPKKDEGVRGNRGWNGRNRGEEKTDRLVEGKQRRADTFCADDTSGHERNHLENSSVLKGYSAPLFSHLLLPSRHFFFVCGSLQRK